MKDKLILPIYLNQKYVFDLLAIIENGFSQVETVKTGTTNGELNANSTKGEVGLSNAFAFLKFGISADDKAEKSKINSIENSKEKIHTPSSLFANMRQYLNDNNLIIKDNFMQAKAGEFIELELSLKKSPLIDAFDMMLSVMKMGMLFDDKPQQNKKSHQNPINENKKILLQIEGMADQLKAEGSVDLIGDYNGEFKVISTIDRDYLGDPSLADIVDGKFSVLGKITRIIEEDSEEEVNLLRKTTLSKLTNNMIEKMFSGFSSMEDNGLKKIDVTTEIKGPAIQMIPIAIFI